MLLLLLLEIKVMIYEELLSKLLSAYVWWKQSPKEVFALYMFRLITLYYLPQTSELA